MADAVRTQPLPAITSTDLLACPLTDLDLASLFADRYQGRVMFVARHWYVWTGTHWEHDRRDAVAAHLAEFLDTLVDAASDPLLRGSDLRKRVLGLRSASRMKSILSTASMDRRLRRLPEELDALQGHINLENGALHVETGELRQHDPSQLVTKKISCRFSPNADAPRFRQFIHEITGGDVELARFLQKALGQAMLGAPLRAQHAFFFLGDGANGKSVLIEAIKHAVGPYGETIAGRAITTQRYGGDPRNTFARLPGVRYAFVSELDEGEYLAEGTIKSLSGGEAVTAMFKYKDEFTFHPECTLFVATNHLPRVRGTDNGLRRRLVAIPFPVVFALNEQDPRLLEALKSEAEGILAWLAEGAQMYLEERLEPPHAVREATARFWSEADPVHAFLQTCTTDDPMGAIQSSELYAAYMEWVTDCGIPGAAMKLKQFGDEMRRHGFTSDSKRKGRTATGHVEYRGIRLVR